MKVLFVCLGNICRSPAAEGVFQQLIDKHHLSNQLFCDSAGTSAYHTGEPADHRMFSHAKNRGFELTSRSRKFNPIDFENFDMIITMDDSNYDTVLSQTDSPLHKSKVHKLTKFCKIHKVSEVPDPYATGAEGFELVMDIVEDGCAEIFNLLKSKIC